MNVGRPQLGYSNLYWTNKITRQAKRYASQREELEEPQAIPLQTLEEKLFENIDREQIKKLADIFCPNNDLTDYTEEIILYTSPQSNGEHHE